MTRSGWTDGSSISATSRRPSRSWPAGIEIRCGSSRPETADGARSWTPRTISFTDHYGFMPISLCGLRRTSTRGSVPAEPAAVARRHRGRRDRRHGPHRSPHRPGHAGPRLGQHARRAPGLAAAWARRWRSCAMPSLACHQRGKRRVGLGVDALELTGATRLYETGGDAGRPREPYVRAASSATGVTCARHWNARPAPAPLEPVRGGWLYSAARRHAPRPVASRG